MYGFILRGGKVSLLPRIVMKALKSHSLKYPYNNLTIDELKHKEKTLKDSVVLSPKENK